MNHSIPELLETVYHHYPRAIPRMDARYDESEEYLRLAEARRLAGAVQSESWRAMLRRLAEAFPETTVVDEPTLFDRGGGYCCWVLLPEKSKGIGPIHALPFALSFLVPYYIVFSKRPRVVDDPQEKAAIRARQRQNVSVYAHDTMYEVPREIVRPEIVAEADREADLENERDQRNGVPVMTSGIHFDFSPDEQPYAERITREIEATFPGYSRMPPEIGNVVVPDVEVNHAGLGAARIYDCLLSDTW